MFIFEGEILSTRSCKFLRTFSRFTDYIFTPFIVTAPGPPSSAKIHRHTRLLRIRRAGEEIREIIVLSEASADPAQHTRILVPLAVHADPGLRRVHEVGLFGHGNVHERIFHGIQNGGHAGVLHIFTVSASLPPRATTAGQGHHGVAGRSDCLVPGAAGRLRRSRRDHKILVRCNNKVEVFSIFSCFILFI